MEKLMNKYFYQRMDHLKKLNKLNNFSNKFWKNVWVDFIGAAKD